MKTIEVTAAVIRDHDQVLICQRPKGKNCALLWEFPGGKIEEDETAEHCIIRECKEELGVTLEVIDQFAEVTHRYDDRIVHLHFFNARIAGGALIKHEHEALCWITADEVMNYEFCPADSKILHLIFK